MDNITPTRGYFSGPEGKVNAITWGAIAVAFFFVVYLMGGSIGDYMVNAADNTLHLAIVAGILLFVVALLVDPKKRAWYVFRALVLAPLGAETDDPATLASTMGDIAELVDVLCHDVFRIPGTEGLYVALMVKT